MSEDAKSASEREKRFPRFLNDKDKRSARRRRNKQQEANLERELRLQLPNRDAMFEWPSVGPLRTPVTAQKNARIHQLTQHAQGSATIDRAAAAACVAENKHSLRGGSKSPAMRCGTRKTNDSLHDRQTPSEHGNRSQASGLHKVKKQQHIRLTRCQRAQSRRGPDRAGRGTRSQ